MAPSQALERNMCKTLFLRPIRPPGQPLNFPLFIFIISLLYDVLCDPWSIIWCLITLVHLVLFVYRQDVDIANRTSESCLYLNSIWIIQSSFELDSKSNELWIYIYLKSIRIFFILFELNSNLNSLKLFNFEKLKISSYESSKLV